MYNPIMNKQKDIHKYIWVEFFIWLLVIIFSVSLFRFHRFKIENQLATYQLFLPDVDGLIVGSPVKYMGVQIGYVKKIKIISNEVYLKFVVTDKNLDFPQGVIATVEFNGMGGSKSLELYPPTENSKLSGRIIVVSEPVRLNDAISLLNDMFGKIDSITSRVSFFAKETGMTDIDNSGLNLIEMTKNIDMADKILKLLNRGNDSDKNNEKY